MVINVLALADAILLRFALSGICVVKLALISEALVTELRRTTPVFNCAALDTIQESIDSSLISVSRLEVILVTSEICAFNTTLVINSAGLTVTWEVTEPRRTTPVFNCAAFDTTQESIDSSLILVSRLEVAEEILATLLVAVIDVTNLTGLIVTWEVTEPRRTTPVFNWAALDTIQESIAPNLIAVDNSAVAIEEFVISLASVILFVRLAVATDETFKFPRTIDCILNSAWLETIHWSIDANLIRVLSAAEPVVLAILAALTNTLVNKLPDAVDVEYALTGTILPCDIVPSTIICKFAASCICVIKFGEDIPTSVNIELFARILVVIFDIVLATVLAEPLARILVVISDIVLATVLAEPIARILVVIFDIVLATVLAEPIARILVVKPEFADTTSSINPRRTIPVFKYAALDTIHVSIAANSMLVVISDNVLATVFAEPITVILVVISDSVLATVLAEPIAKILVVKLEAVLATVLAEPIARILVVISDSVLVTVFAEPIARILVVISDNVLATVLAEPIARILVVISDTVLATVLAEPIARILVVISELADTTSKAEPRRTIPVFKYAALDTIQVSIAANSILVSIVVALAETISVISAATVILVVISDTVFASVFTEPITVILVVISELAVTTSKAEPRRTIPVFNWAWLETIHESIAFNSIDVSRSDTAVTISIIELLTLISVANCAPLVASEAAFAAIVIWVLIDAVLNTKISVIEATIVIFVDSGAVTILVIATEEFKEICVVRSAAIELREFNAQFKFCSPPPEEDIGLEPIE